jgi:CRP/FNR family transcriptional regulator, cyclic AMP receptor protein
MKVTGLFTNAQQTKNVPAGAVVFEAGEPGHEMFGIVEGEIEIRAADQVIVTLGADDTFGELALIERSPRSASAVATKDTVLAVIDQHRFLFMVQETPMFALSVMSNIADRLRAQS